MKKGLVGFILFTQVLFLCQSLQAKTSACNDFADLIHNGAFAVADETGKIILACNPDESFVPASVIKIQTALAALHILGEEYRFQTFFYMDRQHNLYVKGTGDPMLVSEEMENVLQALQRSGVTEIKSIFIDNSFFALPKQAPGRGKSDNPFDSPVSATAVNFNTVNIQVKSDGRVQSAEPQTPTIPIMKEMAVGLKPGTYRVNICQDKCDPDISSARYTAELIRGLQKQAGIKGDGRYEIKKVPVDAKLVYVHKNSKTLGQVVASFLEYSNNYIANLVFLACGTGEYGYPADWDKAQKAVRKAMDTLLGSATASESKIIEGSGLSRRNSTTARAMIKSLVVFKPYQHLMQKKNGVDIKSGTLDGVYNYVGYFKNGEPFVILLNQKQNTRDKVLGRLHRIIADRTAE